MPRSAQGSGHIRTIQNFRQIRTAEAIPSNIEGKITEAASLSVLRKESSRTGSGWHSVLAFQSTLTSLSMELAAHARQAQGPDLLGSPPHRHVGPWNLQPSPSPW